MLLLNSNNSGTVRGLSQRTVPKDDDRRRTTQGLLLLHVPRRRRTTRPRTIRFPQMAFTELVQSVSSVVQTGESIPIILRKGWFWGNS